MLRGFPMTRIEIQQALYETRNNYLKAKASVEFYRKEIMFLKECEANLDKPENWLFDELFGSEVV
jgi:hypothetical protein